MRTETIVIERTSGNEPWEGCINSINYRIERGVPVTVPQEVAELIRRSRKQTIASSSALEKFTEADGVRL